MRVAQSLMAGAGRSDPPMRPGGTTELRGMPSRSSVPPGLCEGRLQVPSDASLGYSQGPLRGETSSKRLVRLFT
jgi:hypothetical protein